MSRSSNTRYNLRCTIQIILDKLIKFEKTFKDILNKLIVNYGTLKDFNNDSGI